LWMHTTRKLEAAERHDKIHNVLMLSLHQLTTLFEGLSTTSVTVSTTRDHCSFVGQDNLGVHVIPYFLDIRLLAFCNDCIFFRVRSGTVLGNGIILRRVRSVSY
jgi:hypothetical protein